MARKAVNTTLDESLYKAIKMLAIEMNLKANDLIEEGMRLVLKKHGVDVADGKDDQKKQPHV